MTHKETHFVDENRPGTTLCGGKITKRNFSWEPSCPECRKALTVGSGKKLRDYFPVGR